MRIIKKNFDKPSIYHNGLHHFVYEQDLTLKSEHVLGITCCHYCRSRGKWLQDTHYYDVREHKGFIISLFGFAVKKKLISERPAVVNKLLDETAIDL